MAMYPMPKINRRRRSSSPSVTSSTAGTWGSRTTFTCGDSVLACRRGRSDSMKTAASAACLGVGFALDDLCRRRHAGRGAPNNDANAGTWQMIVLTSPTQFPVPPRGRRPASTIRRSSRRSEAHRRSSPTRSASRSTTGARAAYCAGTRSCSSCVARADLPPAPRADGTYPVPDANNPFADRIFRSAIRRMPRARKLRQRRAVRGVEGGVVLQVPLQPSVAVEGRIPASRR